MSDDSDVIPEREMKDFQFRQMKKIRAFDSPSDLPKERSSLLAVSNKFGLTFVGLDRILKVFHTRDIIAANKSECPDDIVVDVKSLSVSLDLPIHHLALSSDDLTLSVCGTSNEEPLSLAFYDLRTLINEARHVKRPFASMRPAVGPGILVQDLKWNPAHASILAACLSDGSMLVLEAKDGVTVLAQLPAATGITCICWSPKGKQVAAGKQDATVVQYTHTLLEKKVIPCASFYTADPVKVLDVLWLSTYAFAVVYAPADSSSETAPELVMVSLPKKDERRPENYLNFNELVFGSCNERQHHYFLAHIEDWDLVLAASAASIEVSIIAKQEDKTNWELWLLGDSSRAELPVTLNNDDTLPLGLAVDYTSQEEIHISDEKTLPPAPILMLLSTDGVLCPFSLLNTNPNVKQLITTPASLPLEGERLPSADSLAAPPTAAAVSAAASAPRPPPTSSPASVPAAPPTAPAPAPAHVPAPASSLFSFGTPALQPSGPSPFSMGASGPGAPAGLSLGAAGFSFAAPAPRPASEPAAPSAFSFNTPSAKPPVESAAVPGPAPQRIAATSPITVFKPPAELATPAVKLNLNDRFSAAETPAAPGLQQFSFSAATTSTPKPAFPTPGGQPAALPATSKPASAPARTVQSSPSPSAMKAALPAQPPAAAPAPQASLSIKALERQLQQKKDPVMTGILEEIAHFQKELDDLKGRSSKADFKVGTSEEMQALRKASEELHVFALEIKETTESLHGDIRSLKTTLLEGFAGAEEAKSQSELNRDREYMQLLYKKPLDPRSEEQLKEIRRLFQYVKFAVEDVNDVLDVEWEKHLEKKKKQRHLIVPEREALFTTLSNHLDIIHQQEQKLEKLVKTLQSLRLYGTTSTWASPRRLSPTPTIQGLEGELENLRDALRKASLETAQKAPSKSPVKMTPNKLSQLRNFLSKRQTPPVRSTAPANLSRSAFLSPKYYEDLDDVSSTSSLSQQLEPEDSHGMEEEEPAMPPVSVTPRHPAVVRTPSIQPNFGGQSSLFTKVASGLGPSISPALAGKISASGADTTAFATKTVKHGAPPTERTTPVTVTAQQAAANAAFRRQMANQNPAVGTSLTESTLKTVPQVVNVLELNQMGPPMPVPTAISSASPVPINQSVSSNQAKRNSMQNALKVTGPSGESAASTQPSFVFAALAGSRERDASDFELGSDALTTTVQPQLSPGAASSSSTPSLSEPTSKPFSFSASPAGSFSFTSLSTSSAAASQGSMVSQGKEVSQPNKFSFGGSSSGKMAFGEAPFPFAPKSASPALGRTSTPTPPPSMSAEPPKGAALRVEPQPARAGGSGETLGMFSCLRVGQGEDEAKEQPRPSSVGFSLGPLDNGAEFSFSGAFLQGRPAEPTPDDADSDLPSVSISPAISSAGGFKPPESAAATQLPPSTSPSLSFSSLLVGPLSIAPSTANEDPDSPQVLTEATPPATETPPPAEPSIQTPTPPAVTPPPMAESASMPALSTAADTTTAPENSPTPPDHALSPSPAHAPSPPPSSAADPVTPPTELTPAPDSSAELPESAAAATVSDAALSSLPGSIFTQVEEVSTTLGLSALTTIITTVSSGSTPVQQTAPLSAPSPIPAFSPSLTASTTVSPATVFGQPAPAVASSPALVPAPSPAPLPAPSLAPAPSTALASFPAPSTDPVPAHSPVPAPSPAPATAPSTASASFPAPSTDPAAVLSPAPPPATSPAPPTATSPAPASSTAPAPAPAPSPAPATTPSPAPAPSTDPAPSLESVSAPSSAPSPAPSTTAPSSSTTTSGFGSTVFGTAPAGGFGKPAFGQLTGFGQPASSGANAFSFTQSAFGSSPGFGQQASAPAASSGNLFCSSGTNSASSFSFGHMTTSSGGTTSSGVTGLFGQATTPAFGQQSSSFGQSSVFGSNTTTTTSSGFGFGQPATFGSTPTPSVFGQQNPPSTVFGQPASSSGGLFGSGASGAGGASTTGGGFFSGLGGKPSEDAANKNPFGATSTSGFGQANQPGSSSLFGNSGAKAFGFGTTSFGESKPSGTFSTGVGSVAAQGFGSFNSPAKTGGAFGGAPVFGSPPSFGGSPSFGGTSGFGGAPSFSSPMAPSSGKVFGEGTAAANVGGFGFASASNAPSFGALASQSAPSFGSLANQNTPSFGNLAQQTTGFGNQSSGFSGFGSAGAFSGGGFGSTNQ